MKRPKTAQLTFIILTIFLFLGLSARIYGKSELIAGHSKTWVHKLVKNDLPVSLTAASAILIDATTGTILYQKAAFNQRPPASTTKIVTALIAIEKGKDFEKKIITSERASTIEGSSIWLAEGEALTLRELLYGILLSSGNDAAVAVAEGLAGSEERFVTWMNQKAQKIGARNSNFANCNGLPHNDHYSTAYDLALIARYALQNPLFNEIVKTKKVTANWEEHPYNRLFINHNKLLWRYEFADGVKTGYTRAAGKCLVASATKNNHRLIAVVLKSKNTYWDTRKLFEYGFRNYKLLNLVKNQEKMGIINVDYGTSKQVTVVTGQPVNIVIPKGKGPGVKVDVNLPRVVSAPIQKSDPLGEIQVSYRGQLLSRVPLVAAVPVPEENIWLKLWQWLKNLFR